MARSQALTNIFNLIDAANEELPIERQFLNDLLASIQKQDEKNARKPSNTYKPSSLNCIRNMYFQVTGAEMQSDRASAELVGICESGTDRHERIQNAVNMMKDTGIDCEYIDVGVYVVLQQNHGQLQDLDVVAQQGNETKLYNKKYNMSFLCDGIIKYKGFYYILEIKTESSNKFWNRKEINPDHILQGTAYALNFGINQVIFLYENRDTCNKKVFMLKVTDKMKQDLVGKMTLCDDYVKQLKVPPKPEDANERHCGLCNYQEMCKRYV